MPLTTGYSFGDVVLVPFPFTDQSGSKKRPAVIVSSADYQAQRRDLVIMAITSQIRPRPAFAEFTVAAWKKAGLIAPSTVKPVLTTIDKRPVARLCHLPIRFAYQSIPMSPRNVGPTLLTKVPKRGAPATANTSRGLKWLVALKS